MPTRPGPHWPGTRPTTSTARWRWWSGIWRRAPAARPRFGRMRRPFSGIRCPTASTGWRRCCGLTAEPSKCPPAPSTLPCRADPCPDSPGHLALPYLNHELPRRTSMSRLLFAAALLCVALPAAAQQQVAPTLDDLFRYETISDAQLSPDGTMALYTLRTMNLEKNESDTDIWLVRTQGGQPIRMTTNPKSDSRPRWRPD